MYKFTFAVLALLGLVTASPACDFGHAVVGHSFGFHGFGHVRVVTPFVATTTFVTPTVVATPAVVATSAVATPLAAVAADASCACGAVAQAAVVATPFASAAVVATPFVVRTRIVHARGVFRGGRSLIRVRGHR